MKTRSWDQDRSGAMIPSAPCGKRWPGNCSEIERSGSLGECGLERIGREPMDGSNFPVKFFLLRSREMEGQVSQPP